MTDDLHLLTALDQWRLLQRGDVTPQELTDHYLDRIGRLNDSVGAFMTVTADAARERAAEVAASVPRSAPLWGLPLAEKDLWARAGVRTTYGSRAFEHFVPERSDAIVGVLDAAGAVSLGKTNTPEFGMPGYTENDIAPAARTPWNTDLGAGGSSGGAAAAVAAGLLPFAPGTDGGGSIRIPAAGCGLVGLKPSRGRVQSASGLDSLAGLVVAGPLARTVADAALLLDALIERDSHGVALRRWATAAPDDRERSPQTAPDAGGSFLAAAVRGEGRFRIGVTTSSPWDDWTDITLEDGVADAVHATVATLAAMGHEVESFTPAWGDYGDPFRVIWQAGAARIPLADDQLDEVRGLTAWLVRAGRALPVPRLLGALSALNAFERATIAQFARFDAVLMPSLGQLPKPVGFWDETDASHNFEQQVRYSPFTSFANVTGLPAITLPVGVREGLPVGIQLVGRPGGEATLLSIGAQLERRIHWADRLPMQP